MKIQDILTSDVAKAALQDTVSLVAPRVSKALSGKAGGVVTEAAVRAVSRELLGTDTPDPQRLSERLHSLSPEDQVKLEQIDAEIARDMERIAAEDRADARERQVQTEDRTPALLALLAFGSLVALAAALFLFDPAGTSRDILMTIVGALVVMAKQGYDFFLGSSKGSKDKTGMLAVLKR